MKHIYGVPRVAFLFTGGDLPHAHAHVVPMHENTDITSRLYITQEQLTFRDAPRIPDHELSATAENLVAAFRTIG
jgi:histidine triad (HIT) family protein